MNEPATVREKVCIACRWQRPVTQFYRTRSAADGLDTYCKRCRKGKNDLSNPARSQAFLMLSAARTRAKKQGVPFNLTEADLVIPEYCPILGVRMRRGEGKSTPCSPSLDKIIPALGYVPGNIAVISRRANTIKNDASIHELRALVRWLEAHTEN